MALELINNGISVIPLQPKDKRPNAKLLPNGWKEYQDRIASEEEVKEWYDKEPNGNLGLVTGAISGIVAVDVDGKKGQDWFKKEMTVKPNLFQFTSSKHKFHALYRHPGGKIKNAVRITDEVDIRADGGYIVFAPSIHPSGAIYELREMQGFNGWSSLVMLENITVDKRPTEDRNSDLPLLSAGLNAASGERNSKLASLCGKMFARGMSEDEVLVFARGWNRDYCEPPMSEREVQVTALSMSRTHTGNNPMSFQDGDMTRAICTWLEGETAEFTLDQLDKELGVKFPQQKQERQEVIKKLLNANAIEPVGKRRGVYRKKRVTSKKLDLTQSEKIQIFPMWLPFGLNRNVNVHPKNVIVIAGETNSGKTSFAMNIVRMNVSQQKCKYISSEMEENEFKGRIEAFGDTVEQWEPVEKILCAENPHDEIDPNALNVVDFLEVYGDFWAVGEKIKKIWDALDTGVAIVCLQKKKGEEFARGGEFSNEKARLSFSLFTHGKLPNGIVGSCKVTKSKNNNKNMNPEGKEVFYLLENGVYYNCSFMDKINPARKGWQYLNKKERDNLIDVITKYVAKKGNSLSTFNGGFDFYERENF